MQPQETDVVKTGNWTKKDLPKGIDLDKWTYLFVPAFIDYFAARAGDPWETNGYYVLSAQNLFESVFPNVQYQLGQNNEPVYALVCFFNDPNVPPLMLHHSFANKYMISEEALLMLQNAP